MSSLNASVLRCSNAYHQTYSVEKGKGATNYEAEKAARISYLNLMPDLGDYESIRGFIACVGFAMVHQLVLESHGVKMLQAARVALSAYRNRPDAQKPKAAL